MGSVTLGSLAGSQGISVIDATHDANHVTIDLNAYTTAPSGYSITGGNTIKVDAGMLTNVCSASDHLTGNGYTTLDLTGATSVTTNEFAHVSGVAILQLDSGFTGASRITLVRNSRSPGFSCPSMTQAASGIKLKV